MTKLISESIQGHSGHRDASYLYHAYSLHIIQEDLEHAYEFGRWENLRIPRQGTSGDNFSLESKTK